MKKETLLIYRGCLYNIPIFEDETITEPDTAYLLDLSQVVIDGIGYKLDLGKIILMRVK